MASSHRFQCLCPFIIQIILQTIVSSDAFIVSPSSSSPSPLLLQTANENCNRQAIILQAKAAKKKKTKRTSGGGGGGFGSAAEGSNNSNSGKVRSVSGYTGSGTKPLRDAANTFDKLRKEYGKDSTTDLYVRSPLNDEAIFWYVGKVARCTDVDNLEGTTIPTVEEAVISQKRIILEYAKNQLRPQNFGGPYSKALELWVAPGDSEMDVVQNKVSFDKITGSTSDLSEGFSVSDVGFNPEIYVGDEQKEGGLRVKRDENGDPVAPAFEING